MSFLVRENYPGAAVSEGWWWLTDRMAAGTGTAVTGSPRERPTMRAVVFGQVGAEPVLTSVPVPACPDDGVLVAVRATGVCRSDWHAWRGHDPVALPHVPGHEFAGVISEIGPRVRDWAVGDRVTAPFVDGCGRCAWCRAGQAQVCPDQTQPGFTHAGSFAELVAVRAADTNLVALPEQIDFVTAAGLGCRFASAYRGLTARARLSPGEWVAVYGCGGVGLSAVMIAVALGARVIAVDLSAPAVRRAGELGAEIMVTDVDPVAQVRRASGGGVHVGVDALGSAETAASSVRSLRRLGRHVQIGLMLGAASLAPLPWDLVVAHELEVYGSHGMAAVDYPPLITMITGGRLRPDQLIGSVIGLDQAGAALMSMDDPVSARAGTVVVEL